MTISNPKNFCSGNFFEWLEVYLTEKCNGRCSWCIDRHGYHPKNHAKVDIMIKSIQQTGKKNVILLGGEPLLYPNMAELVKGIKDKNVFVTTNGYLLTPDYIKKNLLGIKGLNISIHSYNLQKNQEIVGLLLSEQILKNITILCKTMNIAVRFNCNIIKGYIDTEKEILTYIEWAKSIGANKIRFAELKDDTEHFVDLAKILDGQYGLNDNPFIFGCNMDAQINGMPVGFRQMCGLQTPLRCRPQNPQCLQKKQVLYYDGKVYDGWQGENMTGKEEVEQLKKQSKKLSKKIEELEKKLSSKNVKSEQAGYVKSEQAGFCCY